jgi:hypothetical protein
VLGKSVGKVTAAATYEDLVQIFGATNLRTDTVSVAEGTEEDIATYVKAETAEEIIVFWNDDAVKKKINRIQIIAEGSPYKTAEGVKIGTTLAELEKLNGKPFDFYGFGWDYGGIVSDWKKGNFDGKKMLITFTYTQPNIRINPAEVPAMGDATFSSADPKLATWRDRIQVQVMEVQF